MDQCERCLEGRAAQEFVLTNTTCDVTSDAELNRVRDGASRHRRNPLPRRCDVPLEWEMGARAAQPNPRPKRAQRRLWAGPIRLLLRLVFSDHPP